MGPTAFFRANAGSSSRNVVKPGRIETRIRDGE